MLAAHWCVESRFSTDPEQPFAEKRLLGWVAMGPRAKGKSACKSTSVLSTAVYLKAMYEADFKDASIFDVKPPMSTGNLSVHYLFEVTIRRQ